MKPKIHIKRAWLAVLLLPVLFIRCTEDRLEVDQLFRPRLIEAIITKNNITIGWYDIHDAVSYTLEASYSADLSDPIFSEDIHHTVVTLTELSYATRVYFRLRANAAVSANSSPWITFNEETGIRTTAIILHSVNKTNIFEEEVYLTWNIDPENPVDSIGLSPIDAASAAAEVGRYLTSAEIAEGGAKITGLEKNTAYRVNIYDTSKGFYDRPYNEVTFRTAGPSAGAIQVGPDDDLRALILQNDTDLEIPEGTTYYLEAGSSYEMAGMTLIKGLRIVAAPGIRPKITLSSNFYFTGMLSEFYLEGIDFYNLLAESYLVNSMNANTSYTIEEFSLVDCSFTGFNRGFIRTQGTGDKIYRNILIEDCIFEVVNYTGREYGFIFLASTADRVESIAVTNTTFYNTSMLGRSLLTGASETGAMDITVSNCTFYNSFGGYLLYLPYLSGGEITITNNLFAGPLSRTAMYYTTIKGTVRSNYYTSDYKPGSSPLPTEPIVLTQSSQELFADPEAADLTIVDKESEVYKEWIGDPRWIK